MPELVLFRRRWHAATDTLPVLTLLLCLFHILWFVPYWKGSYTVEGTGIKYECAQGTQLRVANYFLFALFATAAANELLITLLGLRGGPFETRKRRWVTPLLYFEVALWVLLLGVTVFATVTVFSPDIDSGCWSNNPCQYDDSKFPLACQDKSGRKIEQLSDSCIAILDSGPYFVGSCWTEWLAYGSNWVVATSDYFNDFVVYFQTQNPNATDSETEAAMLERVEDLFVNTSSPLYNPNVFGCNMTIDEAKWQEKLNVTISINDTDSDTGAGGYALMFAGVNNVQEYNEFLLEHPDVFAFINGILLESFLESTGIDLFDSNRTANASDMPWISCFEDSNPVCLPLFVDADECKNWAALLILPKPKTMKSFFEALVITTWVVLGITAFAVFLIFNAFPDYNDVDSWEGSVKSMGRMCCFGGVLAGSAAVGGNDLTVSHEIAKSLNLLFGGIDLDPTDRLLGIYLVSKRQHRRRQQDVLAALQQAGYVAGAEPSNRVLAALHRFTPHRLRSGTRLIDGANGGASHSTQPAGNHPGGAAAGGGKPAGGSTPHSQGSPCLLDGSVKGGAGKGSGDSGEVPEAVPLGQPPVPLQAAAAGAHGGSPADSTLMAAAAAVPTGQQQQLQQAARNGAEALSATPAALPPSPFESALPRSPAAQPPQGSGVVASDSVSRGPGAGVPLGTVAKVPPPRKAKLPMYQHSMLRLRSSTRGHGTPAAAGAGAAQGGLEDGGLVAVEEGRLGKGQHGAEAAAARGGQQQREEGAEEGAQEGAEPEFELGPASGGPRSGGEAQGLGSTAVQMPPRGASWHSRDLRVTSRYHPLLTPSGCAGAKHIIQPPLTPQAAADIYTGKMDAVDPGTVREAQRISRFAVAAYGLQSVIWAKGKRPAMCLANANRLVGCLKRPFKLDDRFRKANFDAIVDITGVAPSDLLYVSYTNVAGGVLPYIIMLHRPSKSVVLSVRGTVSMEDLITDLLSDPVDVADWVPQWVRDEAARRKAAGVAGDASGDMLKAHVGIVSSATAILKDMEERGLLRELLVSSLLRAATSSGRDTQEVLEEFLSSRASAWEAPPVPLPHHLTPATQQPDMRRGASSGGAAPAAPASVSGPKLQEALSRASRVRGVGEEEEAAELVEKEQRHLRRLGTMRDDAEVALPLERAQTVMRSRLQMQGWKFVVTGHSLGAAVATLLGMQLRDRFTDLQCWAFNPPGGLVSWEMAQIAGSYCTSIIVGKDVISRLSYTTSKRVVDEMVVSLARCTRPKLMVLLDVLLGRKAAAMPASFCSFDAIAPEALQMVESYYHASKLHLATADGTEMYPPGNLIFLRPFKGRKAHQTVWDAVWIDAATLISEGILVTPTMMAHHRLFVLADAFESILAKEAETEAAPQTAQGEGEVVGIAAIAAV